MVTPMISEIEGNPKAVTGFHVYNSSEQGAEVLTTVQQFREKYPQYGSEELVYNLKKEYQYAEADINWAVYSDSWKDDAVKKAKFYIEKRNLSRLGAIDTMNKYCKFIESDVLYAVDNCGADWGQEAIDYIQEWLDVGSGYCYYTMVKRMKGDWFTNEDIEYALNNMKIDWVAEAGKKIASLLESSAYSAVEVTNFMTRAGFAEADTMAALNHTHIDWAAEAEEEALIQLEQGAYNYYTLLDYLERMGYAVEDATVALNRMQVDWGAEAEEALLYYVDNSAYTREKLISLLSTSGYAEEHILAAMEGLNIDWVTEEEQRAAELEQEILRRLEWSALSRQMLMRLLQNKEYTEVEINTALNRMEIDWVTEAEEAVPEYLEVGAYSREELIVAMKNSGFEEEHTVAALNRMDVDWAAEEAQKAAIKDAMKEQVVRDYINQYSLSRKVLMDWMLDDGYSEQQATAAIDSQNIDWVAEAMERLDMLMEGNTLTRLQYIDRLQSFHDFTKEEAEAAIRQADIDWNEVALRSMQQVVDRMAQSYDDLVFNFKDDCSAEELEYALNNIVVDWDEEATQKAKLYLFEAGCGYAPESLIEHLMSSHGFTKEQASKAVYSIENVDWNEQAVKNMRWFMQGGHSREDLIELLRRYQFTEEQIEYALKKCNPK